MFVKTNVRDNSETNTFLNIKQEYLAVLAGSVFNLIRLPMISKPKLWEYSLNFDGGVVLESTGGYYLDGFNEPCGVTVILLYIKIFSTNMIV